MKPSQHLRPLCAFYFTLWHEKAENISTLLSSRPMRAKPRHSSTNESGPGCFVKLRQGKPLDLLLSEALLTFHLSSQS